MEITSLTFLGFSFLAVLAHGVAAKPLYQRYVLAIANAIFIGSYVSKFGQVIPLAVFLLAGYGLTEIARRVKSGRVFAAAIIIVLALFVYLKRYVFVAMIPPLPFVYLIVGMSYILFRIIDLIVRAHAGELKNPVGPLSYFNYTCNFLCFISGPIQPYSDYEEQESKSKKLNEAGVYHAFSRIVTGYFKVAVLSAIANYLFLNISAHVLTPDIVVSTRLYFAGYYLLSVVSYIAYLYYNFSGYMDIVIGIGWLLGQELPENFNKPFSARSFLEFWARWHMTLSTWFKNYLFNPLLQILAERFNSAKAMVVLGVVTYFITFLVMGIWHGATVVFVVYGLLMGLGASVNKIWQMLMTNRLGRAGYKAIAENKVYARVSRAFTFAYFSMAVTCLWVNLPQFTQIMHRLGVLGLLASLVALTLVAVFGALVWDVAAYGLGRAVNIINMASRPFIVRSYSMALCIMFILVVMSFFHKAPEFVYKAF